MSLNDLRFLLGQWPRTTTLSSRSRVSGNVSRGEARVNRWFHKGLRTEFALDPRLVSDCFQGGLDTTPTQLSAGMPGPFHVRSAGPQEPEQQLCRCRRNGGGGQRGGSDANVRLRENRPSPCMPTHARAYHPKSTRALPRAPRFVPAETWG